MSATPLDVLLTHGLPAQVLDRMKPVFARVEDVAASLSHHEADSCHGMGPQPCPWRSGGPFADELPRITAAVDAWCAVGWFERGLLATPSPHEGRE